MEKPRLLKELPTGSTCTVLCCCTNWPLVKAKVLPNGHPEPIVEVEILNNFGNNHYPVGSTFKFATGQRVIDVCYAKEEKVLS